MKTVWVLAAALLVATSTAKTDEEKAVEDCVAQCRTTLVSKADDECKSWREQLPRPDLYTDCKVAYGQGREVACLEHCKGSGQDSWIDQKRLDACKVHSKQPPRSHMKACQFGFAAASKQAKKAVADAGNAVNMMGTAAQPAAQAAQPKRVLSANKRESAKNVLEQARQEAQAAFYQDAANAARENTEL